ncbi:MAG: glycosyltransferase family 4 protein, partial [Gemmatimonadales bacterium]|nr:glycosyltransferase family 4 protein [Gemmatimonadales bacterium]
MVTPRVLLIGPSASVVGGQSVMCARLLADLSASGTATVEFLPTNPALPGPLALLQRIRYVRTVVTLAWFCLLLPRRVLRADVVHAFSPSYWAFLLAPAPAVLVARLLGRAAVLHYHSGEADDHLTRWGWHAVPLLKVAHVLAVPSRWLASVFARHGLPTVVVPNHIAPSPATLAAPLAPPPGAGARVLCNRMLHWHYGVDDVLRAFREVRAARPDATLTITGGGPDCGALTQLARDLGLEGVDFVGVVPHDAMPGLYARHDVLLNLSVVDNQPVSLLEAGAAGLPVVTTDTGGIRDLLTDEVEALLVPSRAPEAAARAVLRVLGDAGLAARLGAAARERVLREHRWPAVEGRWRATY